MTRLEFIWDLEDDPDGNFWHICIEGHGISQGEVQHVLEEHYPGQANSNSSGRPLVFGWTPQDRFIVVIYDDIPADVPTVYPVTAYEVTPPTRPRGKRRRR